MKLLFVGDTIKMFPFPLDHVNKISIRLFHRGWFFSSENNTFSQSSILQISFSHAHFNLLLTWFFVNVGDFLAFLYLKIWMLVRICWVPRLEMVISSSLRSFSADFLDFESSQRILFYLSVIFRLFAPICGLLYFWWSFRNFFTAFRLLLGDFCLWVVFFHAKKVLCIAFF